MSKRVWYFILLLLVAMFFVLGDTTKEVSSDYDSAYYVEANNNVFVKLSRVIDDCCYYVVDIVLNGVETIVSSITGN